MSTFGNYTNLASMLAQETAVQDVPQFQDITNYKLEYLKNTMEGIGSMAVGQKGIEAVKLLRTKMKGVAKSKYGFDDDDLADIQESLEGGDLNGAITKLGAQITNKITDAGRNALSGLKDKLLNLKNQAEDSARALQNNAAGQVQQQAQQAQQEEEVPARNQPSEAENIESASVKDDLLPIENRVKARFNNLDGEAQARSDAEFRAQPDYKENPQDFQGRLRNIEMREQAIKEQELNPETTFRDPQFKLRPGQEDGPELTNSEDIFNPELDTQRNPPKFDNQPQQAGDDVAQDAADMNQAAEEAASTATKLETGITDATEGLSALTEASTALDWSPVGWAVTAGLGLASLFGGLEIKAHKDGFIKPPVHITSYAQQADV